MRNNIELIGKEKEIARLSAFTQSGRVPHAVLLSGEQGVGKKTLALHFAQMLLCENLSGGDVCGSCSSCVKLSSGFHPDVVIVSSENGANSIHIDAIRAMRSDAYIKPNEADFKIFILVDADRMTLSAQNALLKVIEEPPGFTHFILTSSSPSALLDTVLSRVVDLPVSSACISECSEFLLEKFVQHDKSEVIQIATVCRGNIGRSLSLLADDDNFGYYKSALKIVKCMSGKDFYGMCAEFSGFERDKQGFRSVVQLVLDMIILVFEKKAQNNDYDNIPSELTQIYYLTNQQFSAIIDILNSTVSDIDRNVNLVLLTTCVSSQIVNILQ